MKKKILKNYKFNEKKIFKAWCNMKFDCKKKIKKKIKRKCKKFKRKQSILEGLILNYRLLIMRYILKPSKIMSIQFIVLH